MENGQVQMGRGAKKDNTHGYTNGGELQQGPPPPKYRCVYCKRIVGTDKSKLVAHEAQCDARLIKEREWALAKERAKRREAKMVADGEISSTEWWKQKLGGK